LAFPALTQASQAPADIARRGATRRVNALTGTDNPGIARYAPVDAAASLDAHAKVARLHRADQITSHPDERATRVNVPMAGSRDTMLVAGSDGTLAGDVRPLVRCSVTVFVHESGRTESASAGGGARVDYSWFDSEVGRIDEYAREA